MKLIDKFDRYITAIFFVTIFIVVATSYFTFKTVILTYNKQQQEATIPLFSWINSEVISPLTLSKFMAKNPLLVDLVEQETLDKNKLIEFLEVYSMGGKLRPFIALEKHNILLDSNGLDINFNHQDAEWYQRIKNLDQNEIADIGDSENPTLYYDVKMHNDNKEFIGFTGVGVDLDTFKEKLREFNDRFGFEVFFVDENNHITLATNNLMKTESHHRQDELVSIEAMPWYQNYIDSLVKNSYEFSFNNEQNLLTITHLEIGELNWKVFVIAPAATSQKGFWLILLSRLGIFVIVALVLYFVFFSLMELFKKDIVADANIDSLTGIPNRNFVKLKFNQIKAKNEKLVIVIADLDHFKSINDTYGHIVGDKIIKRVAKLLTTDLRAHDITARWGGEEFIMILPETELEQAKEICDRLRQDIESSKFYGKNKHEAFNTSMSFGLSIETTKNLKFNQLIANADQALYKAKANGRNRVEVF